MYLGKRFSTDFNYLPTWYIIPNIIILNTYLINEYLTILLCFWCKKYYITFARFAQTRRAKKPIAYNLYIKHE